MEIYWDSIRIKRKGGGDSKEGVEKCWSHLEGAEEGNWRPSLEIERAT